MKHLSASIILAAALSTMASLPVSAAPAATGTPIKIVSERIRAEAEVISVDMKTRVLTLKFPSGETTELIVDHSVKRLADVHPGDTVVAEYQHALAVKLKKGSGIRSTTESDDEVMVGKGKKPAATRAKEVRFVADVTEVDAAAGTITVLGARGNSVTLRVKDPKVLAEVKKGDQVEGSYVRAVAVAVVPKGSAAK